MNTNLLPTTSKWLTSTSKQLKDVGIATARLDCLVLLEDITGIDRALLLADPSRRLKNAQFKKLEGQIALRAKHIPLAYIRQKTEFYGREYEINHSVLEPRPESETMIDLLKRLPKEKKPIIADIGCGSGALAITAKLEIPQAQVIACDIDPACLRVAKRNAKKHLTDIDFRIGNLLDPIVDFKVLPLILLCNLPYVPTSFKINPAALQEPRQAIFGGEDGLKVYSDLFDQLKRLRQASTLVLTEAMPPQHLELANIAKINGFELQSSDDFIQQFWRA